MHDYILESGPVSVRTIGVCKEDLEAFFDPFYTIRPTRPEEPASFCVVVEELDHDSWQARYQSLSSQPLRKQVLYASKKPEHHIEGLRVQTNDPSVLIILFKHCMVDIERAHGRIRILVHDSSDINPILRVLIREVIQKQWEKEGGVLIHATAVVMDGQAHLLIGPKGSGKSNLMLHMVRNGAQILSFDRVIVTVEHERLTVYGWPTYLNLYPETVKRFQDLFPEEPVYQMQSRSQEEKNIKLALIAQNVRHLNLLGSAPWKSIIFPVYSPTQPVFQSRVARHEESIERLKKECLTRSDLSDKDWLRFVSLQQTELEERIQDILQRLAKTGRCFYWYYGSQTNWEDQFSKGGLVRQ